MRRQEHDLKLAARAFNVIGDMLTCSALNEQDNDDYTRLCIQDAEAFLTELRNTFGEDKLEHLNGDTWDFRKGKE